jgi:uncharacterized protein UPF0158
MKRKAIRINWDDLEAAFDNRQEDLVYYLDLVTGDVILEGEGEESNFAEDEDLKEGDEEVVVRGDESRIYIESPAPEDERAWMEDFVKDAKGSEPGLLALLKEAVKAPDCTVAFREALRNHAPERDRWFLYRSDRLHQAMESWLDANGVHYAESPPWKT